MGLPKLLPRMTIIQLNLVSEGETKLLLSVQFSDGTVVYNLDSHVK